MLFGLTARPGKKLTIWLGVIVVVAAVMYVFYRLWVMAVIPAVVLLPGGQTGRRRHHPAIRPNPSQPSVEDLGNYLPDAQRCACGVCCEPGFESVCASRNPHDSGPARFSALARGAPAYPER